MSSKRNNLSGKEFIKKYNPLYFTEGHKFILKNLYSEYIESKKINSIYLELMNIIDKIHKELRRYDPKSIFITKQDSKQLLKTYIKNLFNATSVYFNIKQNPKKIENEIYRIAKYGIKKYYPYSYMLFNKNGELFSVYESVYLLTQSFLRHIKHIEERAMDDEYKDIDYFTFEVKDEETGYLHISHALFNILMIYDVIFTRPLLFYIVSTYTVSKLKVGDLTPVGYNEIIDEFIEEVKIVKDLILTLEKTLIYWKENPDQIIPLIY